jgi:hypothetical protein
MTRPDPYALPVSLIFHWGGDRHGEVADVPASQLTSGLLVYDGADGWIGVYERSSPPQTKETARGRAEVWIVRE